MTTFALIHGAYHTGAHWSPLVEALRSRGHDAVAPDLPATDPGAGAMEYAKVVSAAIPAQAGEDVVVVGHSMGGLTAPVVATLRPVRMVVYVCALVPRPPGSFDEYGADEPEMFSGYARQTNPWAAEDGTASAHPAFATEVYFHELPLDRMRWAYGLLRPQQWRITKEGAPLDDMPDVRNAAIVARDDRVLDPEWAVRTAKERLGCDAIVLPGGHSPQLARPEDLAGVLVELL